MKEKIKIWYKLGLWSKAMVQQAVAKGVLSQAEMDEIIEEVEK